MKDPQGSAEEAGRRHPDFTEQAHAGGASPVPCAQHQSEMCARLGPFLRWKEKVKAALPIRLGSGRAALALRLQLL